MNTRESILTYIETQAAKSRAQAAKGPLGGSEWDRVRLTAIILDSIAADIRAGMDVREEAA